LIWTPFALADMQGIYRFLYSKDTDAARRAVRTIRESIKLLARQPRVGRPVEEMEASFREWPIEFGSSGYIALYRFDGDMAAILAVRHQKEAGYDS
jgi:plasmid stabilization system protein ParE